MPEILEMEWLGSDGMYTIDADGFTTFPGGWSIKSGPADWDICGVEYGVWRCMARQYHEHPHIACVRNHSDWANGNRVISVSLKKPQS